MNKTIATEPIPSREQHNLEAETRLLLNDGYNKMLGKPTTIDVNTCCEKETLVVSQIRVDTPRKSCETFEEFILESEVLPFIIDDTFTEPNLYMDMNHFILCLLLTYSAFGIEETNFPSYYKGPVSKNSVEDIIQITEALFNSKKRVLDQMQIEFMECCGSFSQSNIDGGKQNIREAFVQGTLGGLSGGEQLSEIELTQKLARLLQQEPYIFNAGMRAFLMTMLTDPTEAVEEAKSILIYIKRNTFSEYLKFVKARNTNKQN